MSNVREECTAANRSPGAKSLFVSVVLPMYGNRAHSIPPTDPKVTME